jgi:hypothetical protein
LTRNLERISGLRIAGQLVALLALGTLTCASTAAAQPAARRATDIAALAAYPGFYHGQPIVLRAEIIQTGDRVALVDPDEPRALRVAPGTVSVPTGRVEARGVFWDIGRLMPDDPRITGNNLKALVESNAESDWPKPGELLALQLTDAFPVDTSSSPSLRDLALDGAKHVNTQVTITGQFRGRNLYADLPQAPGVSRWDFVVKLADAAVWVTGVQPKGRGFDLSVNARIDTGRWLEVSGTVKRMGGLVWIESPKISLGQPPASQPPTETAAPQMGPAPTVVFSSPTAGETDVPLDTRVRLQFSRDMDPASFKDQVRVSFVAAEGAERGEPSTLVPQFTTAYDAATRALSLRFSERFPGTVRSRTVNIELLEGIKARDGAPLVPWTLRFVLGEN